MSNHKLLLLIQDETLRFSPTACRAEGITLQAAKFLRSIEVQRDPFSVEWLTENHVTVQECVDLSELIGKILRDYWISNKEEGGNQ